jgi:DnaJ-class molecular chaperone
VWNTGHNQLRVNLLQFFGGSGGGSFFSTGGGASPLDDLFMGGMGGMPGFGGRGGMGGIGGMGGRPRMNEPQVVQHQLPCTLEDLYKGACNCDIYVLIASSLRPHCFCQTTAKITAQIRCCTCRSSKANHWRLVCVFLLTFQSFQSQI